MKNSSPTRPRRCVWTLSRLKSLKLSSTNRDMAAVLHSQPDLVLLKVEHIKMRCTIWGGIGNRIFFQHIYRWYVRVHFRSKVSSMKFNERSCPLNHYKNKDIKHGHALNITNGIIPDNK